MKRLLVLVSIAALGVAGCGKQQQSSSAPTDPAAAAASPQEAADLRAGKVLETMNSGGYTYVRIETAGEELWAAGPQVDVAVGDSVHFSGGGLMTNFHSKSLDRTFEEILFVPKIEKGE